MTAPTIHTHNTANEAQFLAPQDNQGAGVQEQDVQFHQRDVQVTSYGAVARADAGAPGRTAVPFPVPFPVTSGALRSHGVLEGVAYRFEVRVWMLGGLFVGDEAAPFAVANEDVLANELGDDAFSRHGTCILTEAVSCCVSDHKAMARVALVWSDSELRHLPVRIGRWGEFRVVTFSAGA
jgi:hypothetical protein